MLFPLMCPPACLSPCPLSPDLPGRRPLPPQRGHTAAPEPVPGELLRGVLQATGAAVWGGSGGGERRRGLALAPWALNPSPPVRSPAWPPDLRPRPPTPKKHNADIQLCRTCADSRPFLLRFFSAFGLRPSLRPHARTPRLPFQQYDGSAPHVHLQTQSSNPKKNNPPGEPADRPVTFEKQQRQQSIRLSLKLYTLRGEGTPSGTRDSRGTPIGGGGESDARWRTLWLTLATTIQEMLRFLKKLWRTSMLDCGCVYCTYKYVKKRKR